MKKMSKIVSLAMAAALAAASLSMSASADGEDKIEINRQLPQRSFRYASSL